MTFADVIARFPERYCAGTPTMPVSHIDVQRGASDCAVCLVPGYFVVYSRHRDGSCLQAGTEHQAAAILAAMASRPAYEALLYSITVVFIERGEAVMKEAP